MWLHLFPTLLDNFPSRKCMKRYWDLTFMRLRETMSRSKKICDSKMCSHDRSAFACKHLDSGILVLDCLHRIGKYSPKNTKWKKQDEPALLLLMMISVQKEEDVGATASRPRTQTLGSCRHLLPSVTAAGWRTLIAICKTLSVSVVERSPTTSLSSLLMQWGPNE